MHCCSAMGTEDAASMCWVGDDWLFKRWSLYKVVGRGSFSHVQEAVRADGKCSRKYVAKIVDKSYFRAFKTKTGSGLTPQGEARLLRKLSCPSIIKCEEWYETEDKVYIFLEYMEGGDLLQYILERGSLTEGQARQPFCDVAAAVSYLQERRIIHRDLKPENILLANQKAAGLRVKLTDFGTAKVSMQVAGCTTICGTAHYAAPEMIAIFLGGRAESSGGYGGQVDLWSLGVTLYVMLSATPPFEEDALHQRIVRGDYAFDAPEWARVSPEVKELVSCLMQVDPSERYTARQVAQHSWTRMCPRSGEGCDDGSEQEGQRGMMQPNGAVARSQEGDEDVREAELKIEQGEDANLAGFWVPKSGELSLGASQDTKARGEQEQGEGRLRS